MKDTGGLGSLRGTSGRMGTIGNGAGDTPEAVKIELDGELGVDGG